MNSAEFQEVWKKVVKTRSAMTARNKKKNLKKKKKSL
jgi:hypothetical protein